MAANSVLSIKLKLITMLCFFAWVCPVSFVNAQTFDWISTSDKNKWQQQKVQTILASRQASDIKILNNKHLSVFEAWGTCFNELGWDALNMLPNADQKSILSKLFNPTDDLRFTLGRIPMNANDYARDWYSCDEVPGDFELKYFNIKRDETALIPFIKQAQIQNPNLNFWLSPWSPPSWMKINNYYSVRSDSKLNKMLPESDVALFENNTTKSDNVFPKQMTVNDFLIQDARYLKTYADYFCKFIDAYNAKGIDIKTVMYQNEAYSYTIYPGCAWTADGSIRFNTDFLGPALKEKHPGVSLYLGTINTNRFEVVDKILSDPRTKNVIKGIGFQWEGGEILPRIREKYPNYKYVQTESECGWGSFDWKAAEHTFERINHYLGNGCTQYTFWNAILADEGFSGWGWKQNALIRVNSKTKMAMFTPEYYAVKHYTHYINQGCKLIAWKSSGNDKKPILLFRTPAGKYIMIAGNFLDKQQKLSLALGKNNLEVTLEPHSLNTFQEK